MGKKLFRVIWGPWRFRMPIGVKALIAFLVIITSLAGGLYYFASVSLSAHVEKDAKEELRFKMQGAWRLYHTRPEQMKFGMLQAATHERVRAAISGRKTAYLQDVLGRYSEVRPYVDMWAIVGPDRRVIARRSGNYGDFFEINGIIERALRTGEPVLSTESVPKDMLLKEGQEIAAKVDSAGLMQLSVVPVNENGRITGAFVTGVLLNRNAWVSESIYEYLKVNSSIYQFDYSGGARTISASGKSNGIFNDMAPLPDGVSGRISRGASYIERLELESGGQFLSVEPIRNSMGQTIGALAIASDSSEIQGHVSAIKSRILLVAALGVLFSIFLAWLVYRDTSKPVKAIRAAMEETVSGNLNIELDIRTKDEFEDIGQGFTRMLNAIRVREARLDRFNQLSQILIQFNDPKLLLDKALSKIIELTGSCMGAVYMFDESCELLKPEAFCGTGEADLKKLKKGEGLAGRCIAEQKTILLQDISQAELTMEAGLLKVRPSGLVWFPMYYKEKAQGVLVLGSIRPYEHDEVGHIEHLIAQLSIALDNALIHKEIEKLSVTDPLTGVLNRRRFVEILGDEFRASRRYKYSLGVLMVDVDDFKSINDTLGHQQGDAVLSELSLIIKEKTRTTDIWARYGGEEFIGLVTHSGIDGMDILSEKLRKSIEEHDFPGMKGRRVTVSIGVGYYPSEGVKDIDDLIRVADENLYQAKNAGKNRVVMNREEKIRLVEGV